MIIEEILISPATRLCDQPWSTATYLRNWNAPFLLKNLLITAIFYRYFYWKLCIVCICTAGNSILRPTLYYGHILDPWFKETLFGWVTVHWKATKVCHYIEIQIDSLHNGQLGNAANLNCGHTFSALRCRNASCSR